MGLLCALFTVCFLSLSWSSQASTQDDLQRIIRGALVTASCESGCTGKIDLGTTSSNPLTIQWSNGETGGLLNGLCPGIYCVTISTPIAPVVTVTSCFEIKALLPVGVTGQVTMNRCFGACDVEIDLTVSGSGQGYTVLWSDGSTLEDRTGLCPGYYSVTVEDSCGYQATQGFEVSDSADMLWQAHTARTCPGQNQGGISFSVDSSYTYSFQWSDGSQSSYRSNLDTGLYCVTVTASNGCVRSQCIRVYGTIYANAGSDMTICPGDTVLLQAFYYGSHDLVWTPGTYLEDSTKRNTRAWPPYTTEYVLTLSDNYGCTTRDTVLVTVKELEVKGTVTNSCQNQCSGAIDLDVTGSGVTFQWSNGDTTEDISGLCPGTYSVTATDDCGETKTLQFTVQSASALSVQSTPTKPCRNSCNGAIDLQPSGGLPPYTYAWSNGATTSSITNLCAGKYCYTVTDACGTTVSGCQKLGKASSVAYTAVVQDDCSGGCNGSIDLTVTSGKNLTYAWSNGATTEDVQGLCAGTYCVTVRNKSGCEVVTCYQVAALPDVHAGKDTTICAGNSVQLGGPGVQGATYQWSPSASLNRADTAQPIATPLSTTTYTVTQTLNGCTTSDTVTVEVHSSSASATVHDGCGPCDGSVVIQASSTNGPIVYQWSNGASASSQYNLCSGTYTITVRDQCGQIAILSATIQTVDTFQISVPDGLDTCYPAQPCRGVVYASISGHNGPVTYAWSNGGSGAGQSGLCPGNYSVTATDSCGKVAVTTFAIHAGQQPQVSGQVKPTCANTCNGQIDLTLDPGTNLRYYYWTDGYQGEDRDSLCAGTYCVRVVAACGYDETICFTVEEREDEPLNVSMTAFSESCPGACDGLIRVDVSGNGPFTYAWSDGGSGSERQNLCPGLYSVTVTDDCGQSAVRYRVISGNRPVSIYAQQASSRVCVDSCNGKITVIGSGGDYDYSYAWSDGSTSRQRSRLCAGTYCVTVTDGCGNQDSICFDIDTSTSFTMTGMAFADSCVGGPCSGIAYFTTEDGVEPFTANWSDGSTYTYRNDLCAGSYCVTAQDACGHTDSICVVIDPPKQLKVSSSVTHSTCQSCDGSISVSIDTGTTHINAYWTDGYYGLQRDSLCPGTYCLRVTDWCDYDSLHCFTIKTARDWSLRTFTKNPTCEDICDGYAYAAAPQGATFLWSDGSTAQQRNDLCCGTYQITATDSCGTQRADTFTLACNEPWRVSVTQGSWSCEDPCSGIVAIQTNRPVTVAIAWSDGGSGHYRDDLCPGTYCITVSDSCGTDTTICVELIDPTGPYIHMQEDTTICQGSMTTIQSNIQSGGRAYSCEWAPSQYLLDPTVCEPTFVGLVAGWHCYTLTVRDTCVGTVVDSVCIFVEECGLALSPGMQASPNPSNGKFSVAIPEAVQRSAMAYELRDPNGVTVWQRSSAELDPNGLVEVNADVPSGLYLFSVRTHAGTVAIKVLIE